MSHFIGRCPDCGTKLEKKTFVDVEDEEGNPVEVYEDWWCHNCRIRWLGLESIPKEADA